MLEKYHWTFEYVMWGISYMNLQMLFADAQEHFTDFSGKNGGSKGSSGETVNADDPQNIEKMHQMLGW